MRLYYHPFSNNCRRVVAVAKHLNLDLETEFVDLEKGEQQSEAFLGLNPNAKVPVLTDGDFVLTEGNAIMAYLASKKDNDLWPKDERRYEIMRWFNWEAAHFQCEAVGRVAYQRIIVPMIGGTPNEMLIASGERFFERFAKVLDTSLAGREWLVGDAPSLADFSVGSNLDLALAARLPVDQYSNIVAWHDRLNAVPAWSDSAPET